MNKKIFIVLFVFLAIAAIIIFGFKSCSPRKKTISSEVEAYSAFINANIEFTCAITKNLALAQNTSESREALNEIYAKYNLPVQDDASMLMLLEQYKNNAEVTALIQQNTANCLQGGSPIFYQNE